MKPYFIWAEACCRLFIENEVRTIEKDIERWLGNQLKKLGCIYMKFVSPGNDGVPDRIVILPGGSVIFIELKSTQGKLMANQRVQISRLRKQGALVFVLTGKLEAKLFLDDIERVIHGLSSTRVPRDCYSADN
ncbi:VRR-NUC domain-containing protein [Veillonella rogosae]|uniref:VRR-NUC domain-containing protein n=1 Tax=Veillonella rogosae TaxID=423477 RepID=UPI0039A25380